MQQVIKKAAPAYKRIVALALALMLALSLGLLARPTSQGVAATADPYFMSYDLSGGDFTYTYVLGPSDTGVYIQVGPADYINEILVPTYFDDESDADDFALLLAGNDPTAVEYITGDGLEAPTISYAAAYEVNTGDWGVEAYMDLAADDTYGSLSIQITNPGAAGPNNYTNLSVVRNQADPPLPDSVGNVDLWIFDPADTTGALHYAAGTKTIRSNEYYEAPVRTFPTGFDTLFAGWYEGYIPQLTYIEFLTGTPWIGDYINSMTVNGVAWATVYISHIEYNAWFSAVYRYDTSSRSYTLTELGRHIGGDSYRALPGDIIVWKYGYMDTTEFDTFYDALFPATL